MADSSKKPLLAIDCYETAQRRSFVTLPVEVVNMILIHLSSKDLKNLRRSCRYLHDAASQYVFRDLTLYPHLDSIKKLQQITENDLLRQFVSTMKFECRWGDCFRSMKDYYESELEEPPVAGFTEALLTLQMLARREVSRGTFENNFPVARLLSRLIQRLPFLHKVTIHCEDGIDEVCRRHLPEFYENESKSLLKLAPIQHKALMDRDILFRRDIRQPSSNVSYDRMMCCALDLYTHAMHFDTDDSIIKVQHDAFFKVECLEISNTYMQNIGCPQDLDFEGSDVESTRLSKLKTIRISYANTPEQAFFGGDVLLSSVIRHAPNIESINIRSSKLPFGLFRVQPFEHRGIGVCDALLAFPGATNRPIETWWWTYSRHGPTGDYPSMFFGKRLKHLELWCTVMEEQNMEHFVNDLEDSLENLSIGSLVLLPRRNAPPRRRGCLVKFISTLRRLRRLSSLTLRNDFTNGPSQSWFVIPSDNPDCLYRKVIDFVLKRPGSSTESPLLGAHIEKDQFDAPRPPRLNGQVSWGDYSWNLEFHPWGTSIQEPAFVVRRRIDSDPSMQIVFPSRLSTQCDDSNDKCSRMIDFGVEQGVLRPYTWTPPVPVEDRTSDAVGAASTTAAAVNVSENDIQSTLQNNGVSAEGDETGPNSDGEPFIYLTEPEDTWSSMYWAV